MTGFCCSSSGHGTQDLYPTFLQKKARLYAYATSSEKRVATIANFGAILGGPFSSSSFSQLFGRRSAD